MKQTIFIIGILISLISCNIQTKNNETDIVINKSASPEIQVIEQPDELVLNDAIKIDSDSYILAIQSAKDTISDFKAYKLKEFTRIKYGQNQFKYYLLGELKFDNSFKSYLIGEYYESEQSCWLANYDKENNLISYYEVFYDNAEGAWTTTSIISEEKKILQITAYDAYSDPTKNIEMLSIDGSGEFVKQ